MTFTLQQSLQAVEIPSVMCTPGGETYKTTRSSILWYTTLINIVSMDVKEYSANYIVIFLGLADVIIYSLHTLCSSDTRHWTEKLISP